jgi:hypothetical protein
LLSGKRLSLKPNQKKKSNLNSDKRSGKKKTKNYYWSESKKNIYKLRKCDLIFYE